MRKITLLIISGLLLVVLAGCNEANLTPSSREKRLEDNPDIVYRVDADGNLRGPLPISLESLIINELEERLGISPDKVEDKSPEDFEKLGHELKSTLTSFSQITIVSAHKLLNRYFWPEDESEKISLNQLKEEIAELEKEWENAVAEMEEFKDIPAVEAYTGVKINVISTSSAKKAETSLLEKLKYYQIYE
ncbi:MAG: hypothetical protein QHH75_03395 [Bacillota bacterium]|nr:hypothetical protein [Bacillota bacterium]